MNNKIIISISLIFLLTAIVDVFLFAVNNDKWKFKIAYIFYIASICVIILCHLMHYIFLKYIVGGIMIGAFCITALIYFISGVRMAYKTKGEAIKFSS